MSNLSKKLESSLIGNYKRPLKDLVNYTISNDLQCIGENFLDTRNILEALNLLKNQDGLEDYTQSKIEVVFDDIHFRLNYFGEKKKEWFSPLHFEFLPNIRDSPTGANVRYFYSKERNEFIVRDEFLKDKTKLGEKGEEWLYQIFLDMFGGALRGYSCFIGKDSFAGEVPSLRFHSHRYLEEGEESFKEGVGRWKGDFNDFITSAEMIEKAIGKMLKKDYRSGRDADNETRIMLNHPNLGVVLMTDKPQKYSDLVLIEGKFKWREITLPTTFIFKKESLNIMGQDKNIV